MHTNIERNRKYIASRRKYIVRSFKYFTIAENNNKYEYSLLVKLLLYIVLFVVVILFAISIAPCRATSVCGPRRVSCCCCRGGVQMSYLYDHDCDCGSTVCVSAMAPLIGPGHVAAATTSKVHYTRPRIVTLHNGRWQWTVGQRDGWTVGQRDLQGAVSSVSQRWCIHILWQSHTYSGSADRKIDSFG